MALPATPKVVLRLGTGAAFGNVFVLGDPLDGILGTNILGTSTVQTVDVTDQTVQISTRRGRDRVFEHYTAGQATVRFIDFNGDWNPSNASSPYVNQILPLRQLRITAEYSGTDHYLFTGYITSWDWEWPKGASFGYVTITADDGFRLLALSNVDNVTGASTGDLPGTRINQILDMVNWPSQMRNIDTGVTELQNDPGGLRPTLTALQTVEDTELGSFYMDTNGDATFVSRYAIAQQASGTPTEFADNGTGIAYQQLDVSLDDQELSNIVTITPHGGTAETATDATSIDTYFARTLNRSELLMRHQADAYAQALLILAYRKNIRLRVNSIGLDLSSPSTRVAAGLDLDIGDPITVLRTVSGTDAVDTRLTIQGVAHDITPDRWTTTFTTREPLSTAFILGSLEFGVLGTNTL